MIDFVIEWLDFCYKAPVGTVGGLSTIELVTLIVSILALGVSGIVAYVVNLKTSQANRRSEYVTQTLVEAYLAIEKAYGRDTTNNKVYKNKHPEWQLGLEDAIAKIQLLGPSELAEKVARNIAVGKPFSLDEDFMTVVRSNVRTELGLNEVKEKVKSIRSPNGF